MCHFNNFSNRLFDQVSPNLDVFLSVYMHLFGRILNSVFVKHNLNPHLTESIFAKQLTKGGGVTTSSDFPNEPPRRMMLILVPF